MIEINNVHKKGGERTLNKAPKITGHQLILRQPIEKDIIDYFNIELSKEFVRMQGGNTQNIAPKTLEEAKRYIKAIQDRKLEWCVEYEGRLIGHARLTVNEADNNAKYAVGIFDSTVWGKGLGTEITQLVLHYCFEHLKLHRVELLVLKQNKRAIRCYEKSGFIQEGTVREGSFIDGVYESDIIMSILDREYDTIKDSFTKYKLDYY